MMAAAIAPPATARGATLPALPLIDLEFPVGDQNRLQWIATAFTTGTGPAS